MSDPVTLTLPISPGRVIHLEFPAAVTAIEWHRMLILLDAMYAGVVEESAAGDQ